MKRIIWVGLILVVVLLLAGCGSRKSPSHPPGYNPPNGNDPPDLPPIDPSIPGTRYLYALSRDQGQISVFKINSDGTLEQVNQVVTNDGPGCAVVHPDGNHLFVSTSGSGGDFIEIYGIDGYNLSLINANKMPAGGARQLRMVLSPDGEYLFVAHEDKNFVSIFRANPTAGTLDIVTTIGTGTQPKALAVSPQGKYLYIAKNGTNILGDDGEILVYQIAATGSVTPKGSVTIGRQPSDMVLNHAGSYLYVANYSSGSLMVFAVNSGEGTLTHKHTYTGDAGDVQSLAVAPDDHWVFAGKTAYNAYAVSGSDLSLVVGSPFYEKLEYIKCLKVDPSGRFLYAGRGESKVEAFTIGSSGKLTLAGEYEAGGQWVTIR
ncbi:lactonase family protein [Capillibacterium thermochitinicola]|uniref:Beta-propeller fold lactonase family protein n=1 Tax=Capillibacterium thermochitinicola TaxID=2699427 RepID=A0A8J6I0T4_9FIRM|nr:beta-propeller fold lactonase family protein [Capillibacterium thermochitinicola]MBA2133545.1 beta-propeller fold lactonase family protein [Capillibacterium thermochitinicola]